MLNHPRRLCAFAWSPVQERVSARLRDKTGNSLSGSNRLLLVRRAEAAAKLRAPASPSRRLLVSAASNGSPRPSGRSIRQRRERNDTDRQRPLPDTLQHAAVDERHQHQGKHRQAPEAPCCQPAPAVPGSTSEFGTGTGSTTRGEGCRRCRSGSASRSSGTRTATASVNRIAKAMKIATVSLNTCSG